MFVAATGATRTAVVRSTQFHDFPGQILTRARVGPFAVVPRMRIQPIAIEAVARTLLNVAEEPDPAPLTQIAGPRQEALVRLAHQVSHSKLVRKTICVPVPIPGQAGRAIRAGAPTLPSGPAAGPRLQTGWRIRPVPGPINGPT